MSLIGFENLRTERPELEAEIGLIETEIARILVDDSNSIIDDRILLQQTRVSRRALEDILAELVKRRALQEVWLWRCPVIGGTLLEKHSISGFPDAAECDRCGNYHQFDIHDTDVFFLATGALIHSLPLRA